MSFEIIHIGGEQQVTGSCHLLQANGLNMLIDCGLAQGRDAMLPINSWPVKPEDVDYLFLTHVHIDHIGRIPELIQSGFAGEIITTHPSKSLLSPMLEDAMGFSGLTDHDKKQLMETIDDLSWGFEYHEKFDLKKGITFELGSAGHILGSCFIRIDTGEGTVVFSGDIGAKDTPVLPDPDIPSQCDILILESTYGDRLHEDRTERIQRLGHILTKALSDNGKVFIPAFSLGRTQELIYEMDRLFSDSQLRQAFPELNPRNKIPVFVDSPLGLEITKIYAGLSEYWDKEARDIYRTGDHPIDFDHLYAVRNYRDHLKLLEMPGPAIIIAGSGMCTGGRIIDHLKTGLADALNDVLFVGYQAEGTLGRDIVRYAGKPDGYVITDGERVPLGAKVYSLTGYSAHADQKGLVEWVESMPEKPGKIKLVHGDTLARQTLASVFRKKGYSVLL
ncbi:MBL fold metallo-hydrolase [Desulfococcaceae bacterium HSG8]|nr:MBL fold metallo-hydrolase [Desulfococcaceae bacterium HSG8]